jgi:hypothetical protein
MDATDEEILNRLRDMYGQYDPVPPDLAHWVAGLVVLGDFDVEICRLTAELPALMARGPDSTTTTVTFESSDVTIMLRLDRRADGTLRIDGWLAPAAACDIDLRTEVALLSTRSDDNGRFSFDPAPQGLAHLLVRGPTTPGRTGRMTVTQSVML